MAYAIAYLAAIPIFAGVFWMLPYHFYHSTVQYEGVLDRDADSILRKLLCAFGLLGMRKWAVVLYFVAHSVTITRLVLVSPDALAFLQNLASIKLLWFVGVPIAVLLLVVPKWRWMSWV